MNQTKFDQLMIKFKSTTWEILNAESNTQILSTILGSHRVRLYRGDTFAIDGERPDLTDAQIIEANNVTQEILDTMTTEINDAVNQRNSNLNQAIDDVINA